MDYITVHLKQPITMNGSVTHQAAEGVVEPVVQCEPLHHLKKRGVVKATGVSGDKFIHAMFLSSVSIYPANGRGEKTWFRGEGGHQRGRANYLSFRHSTGTAGVLFCYF